MPKTTLPSSGLLGRNSGCGCPAQTLRPVRISKKCHSGERNPVFRFLTDMLSRHSLAGRPTDRRNLLPSRDVNLLIICSVFISEVYESFQGEGPLAGTPSLFIRTSGCNLRCSFCDTPYTSWDPQGEQISLVTLTKQIELSSAAHVVITGGEPMLAPQLTELPDACRAAGRHVTIETAGTVRRSVECDLMAISPKMANSTPDDSRWRVRHEETRFQPAVIRTLLERFASILKFVIGTAEDVLEVQEWLTDFPEVTADQVWLMPQAVNQGELERCAPLVQQLARENGFCYSPRLHVEQFGDQRGV